MAALTKAISIPTKPRAGRDAYEVSSGTIYAGSLVGTNAAGSLIAWDPAASTTKFVGIAEETVTGGTDVFCRVNTSGVTFETTVTGATGVSDINSLVQCSSSNYADCTLTIGAGAKAVGYVKQHINGTTCVVELFTPAEHLGL